MQLFSFTVGPFQENTYLLVQNSHALLVDPGFNDESEMQAFQQKLEEAGADLQAVLLTHAHVDHALGLNKVLNEYEVPVFLNNSDLYLWNNFSSQAAMFGFRAEGFDFTPENIPIQENWKIGNFNFDVLYTPGHAPDHVSLYSKADGLAIAGDALFREGIGRTDLYKGNMNVLQNSIREKLYTLPDDTAVYPGHGPKTTIGYEKSSNPFVKG